MISMRALAQILLSFIVWSGAGYAHAQITYQEVISTGFGEDSFKATIQALESAVEQVNGVRISTNSSLYSSERTANDTIEFEEKFRQDIEKITKGVVKSYSVLETGVNSGTGRTFVKIKAVVPSYAMSEQLRRLRLAVVPMLVVGAAKGNPAAASFAEQTSAALESYLTQSRKFAMIDRRLSKETSTELEAVNSPNMAIEETVRQGNRVGADYVVIMSVKNFQHKQQQQQRVTGRLVTRSYVTLLIDVRVIDIATGQIKFAQTYNNPGRLPVLSTLSEYAEEVGYDMGQIINTAIYPIVVVSASRAEVILNQGGATVQVGRVYRLVKLGRDLTDPHTGESLGQEEQEIARVEVTSVTDRISTAKVISGRVQAPVKSGAIFARIVPQVTTDTGTAPLKIFVNPTKSDKDNDW